MNNYSISCCSTADLSKEHFEKRNIRYICFHAVVGGNSYLDDLGVSLPPSELYAKMSAGEDAKTSQVNSEEYTDFFEEELSKGNDVLHICLSSGVSGSFNSARIAAEDLREKYPDRKIIIIDSLAASSGFGLLMDEIADRRDEGMDIEAVAKWAEENKLKVHHWFFSTDLTYFIKGGRVSKTSGFIGNVLNICPLLNVDFEGHLVPREKIRTKKKVLVRDIELMKELAENGTNYSGKVYISHSDCLEDAEALAKMIKENFPKIKGDVEIYNIGTTIGSHTGPGTVALFFLGKERTN